MNDDLLKSLLEHDVDERLPQSHERRIREGLGGLLAAPSAPSQDAPASAPAAGAALRGALAKWTTVGILVLGGAGAGFVAGRATAPRAENAPPSATLAPVTTTSAPPATVTASASSGTSTPNVASPSGAPAAVATSPAHAAASAVAAPGIGSADPFDREQSLLERARSALVRHDAVAAAQALDECERSFPRALHAEERDYLRIQTLRERGDNAGARQRARVFLAEYPSSLLRGRVERLAE